MIDVNNREIRFALQAVRQAALLISRIQMELVSPVLIKKDNSSVTIADFASQALIGAMISDRFPSDVLVAEEDAHMLRLPENRTTLDMIQKFIREYEVNASSEKICDWVDCGNGEMQNRYWVLDPLDGTKGFIRGRQYAVGLALIENGQVQISVMGCPNITDNFLEEIFGSGLLVIAVKNQGTWATSLKNPTSFNRLSVSDCNLPTQARILRSFEAGHTNEYQVQQLADKLGIKAAPVPMDSQAKYALLSAGRGELVLRMLSPQKPDYREKVWDQAPGALIVEEAGGRVTDLDGKPLDFSQGRELIKNRGVLASNSRLHELTLDAVKEVSKGA